MSTPIATIPKNSREAIRFSLGQIKNHKFVDMRVFAIEDGKDPVPTKKGLAVSPVIWAQFRAALAQLEAAMIEEGWLDREDLEAQE
ncbi:MAG: transcriptional coactivator p15/PC4 family protein [Desulfobaccales bacterium]